MGTRALRKLREQEWEKQLAAQTASEQESSSEDEAPSTSQPRNAFDMLNDANDTSEPEADPHQDSDREADTAEPAPTISSKPKKKKKKKPKKKAAESTPHTQSHDASEDEIDKALKELSTKENNHIDNEQQQTSTWEQSTSHLLRIDPRNLDPVNEMRGLFGSIALEDDHRTTTSTRHQSPNGGVDLETALSGRYNRASRGRELGSLARRRNCLMQGKEHWPLATSGGLSMSCTPSSSIKEYTIQHSAEYAQAQAVFRGAVESMQAEAMIGALQTHPYHIATLLQVAEIAKHQGDSSLSGDLLQRALYTFGRSVHSSFPTAIKEGTARVEFRKGSNRELYLAIWRYIRNLEQRGTWKTAYEWAKLLLQLDPESDPYGVTLMIDQLALRGRQHEQFLSMTEEEHYGRTWSHLPNICISRTLALLKAGKPKEARRQLALAMERYPYILGALASALEITMPKQLWGKQPKTEGEKFHSELYVTRARDLWNTPETIGLISEVASTLQYYREWVGEQGDVAPPQISLEEARHVVALEMPSLIALVPRQFTNMPTSSSDILPPPDSETSELTRRAPGEGPRGGPTIVRLGANIVQRFMDWFSAPAGQEAAPMPEADLNEIRQQLGPQAEGLSDQDLQAILADNLAAQFGDHIPDDIDTNEIHQALASGMAGGWDYYEMAANEGESDTESMPSLEDIHDPYTAAGAAIAGEGVDESASYRNPHAVTIEEAEDEDAPRTAIAPSTAGPVIDRIDQDPTPSRPAMPNDGLGGVRLPAPSAILEGLRQYTSQAGPERASVVTAEDIESDPQRLQRWLITTGLDEIKANPNLSTYCRRLRMLNKNQQSWILGMVKQRGSGDLATKVEQSL